MAEGTTASSGDSVKRVRLEVRSNQPNLQGLTQMRLGLERLAGAAKKASAELATLSKLTGFDLSNIGKSAQASAAVFGTAMNTMVAKAKAAQGEMGAISGKLNSTTIGQTSYSSGARTRLQQEVYKEKFKTSSTTERLRQNKETGVWESISTEEKIKHDVGKENAASQKQQVEEAARRNKARARRRQRAQEAAEDARAESVEAATRSNEAAALLRKRAEKRAEEERADSVDAAKRSNKAAEIRRKRSQDRAEAAKETSVEAAARRNQAAKLIRERTEGRTDSAFQTQYTASQRAYQMSKASIPSAAGKATSVIGAIYQKQIAAERAWIAELNKINGSLNLTAKRRAQIAEEIHQANLRITKIQAGGGGGPGGGSRWLATGLKGWTPVGFLKNMLTAGGWMMAVGTFMKVAQTVGYTYGRIEQLQLGTARLDQVFRGAGGTSRELADDVLKLAAAEGRGTEEAMNSAIAWSRLGLTRRQAAEATKVSLMAANVAEIDAGDATQRLAAVMASYNLQVSELGSVLGMLNQSSNTYRVTNKDLLDGLSKVGSVAQQAGMSLAELSGLLAASVQKTGQTGTNMANAIKTILTRMNRSDVQGFFAKRFNVDIDGTAQDLRKVWDIYSKVNDEQRLDIMLKIGGATQANRFRAVMESYSEGIMAAVEELQNLNSAEQENIKVTNTAAAARSRLVSSWDRFANSPGVEQFSAGRLNDLSGIIAGFTGGTGNGNRKTLYANPDKATKMGAVMGIANGLTAGIGGWAVNTIVGDINSVREKMGYKTFLPSWQKQREYQQGFRDTPQTGADKFQASMQDVYNHSFSGDAADLKAKHFRDVASNWSNYTDKSKENILDSFGKNNRVSADTLAKLRNGDTSGLVKEAELLKQSAESERAIARAKSDSELKSKEGELVEAQKSKNIKDQKEIQSQILEIKKEIQYWDEKDDDQLTDQYTKMERMVRAMAMQKGLAEDIGQSFKGFGLSKQAEEVASLKERLRVTQQLADSEKTPDVQDALKAKAVELSAELAARQSVNGRFYAGLNSRRDIASSFSQAEIKTSGVGLSEGEKLLAQRKFIAAEISRIGSQAVRSDNDLLKLSQLHNSSKLVELQLSERILENDQERKQVMIETQREFQKTLIGAGPGEILRKLATSRLSGRKGGLTSGQFFAMSPDMRGDAYSLMGGERMAGLNAERRALGRGGVLGLSGLQSHGAAADAASEKIGESMRVAASSGAAVAQYMSTAAQYAQAIANSFMAAMANSRMPDRGTTAPSATSPPQAAHAPRSGSISDYSRARDAGYNPSPLAQYAAARDSGWQPDWAK